MLKLKIFTDGGSRGNPGEAAYGFVIFSNDSLIIEVGKYIGIATNNEAEYKGILNAILWIKENIKEKIDLLDFNMDSLLVCQQLKGVWKIKNANLKLLNEQIRLELKKLGINATFTHIPREQNKNADRMVNVALDEKLQTF